MKACHPAARDFAITAWLDSDGDGQWESGEDKQEVDVHVFVGDLVLHEPDGSAVADNQEASLGGEIYLDDNSSDDVVALDVKCLSSGEVPGKFALVYTNPNFEVFADQACTQPIASGAPVINPSSSTRLYVKGLSGSDPNDDASITLYYCPTGEAVRSTALAANASFAAFAGATAAADPAAQNAPLDKVNVAVVGIKRDGGPQAEVVCGPSDTIAQLAKKIGLNPADYQSWLTIADGGQMPTSADQQLGAVRKFSVPNTIYAVWAGDDVIKLFRISAGQIGISWRDDIKYLQGRGFNVVEKPADNSFLDMIGTASTNKTLQGFFFWGHGAPNFIGNKDLSWSVTYKSIVDRLNYGMGFVLLDCCFSDHKAGDPSMKFWFPNQPLTLQDSGPVIVGGHDLLTDNSDPTHTANPNAKFYGSKGILSPFQRVPFIKVKFPGPYEPADHPSHILKPGDQGTKVKKYPWSW